MLLITIVIGCKKTTTAPAAPPPSTTTVTASALTTLDSCMLGDWAIDTVQVYSNAVLVGSAYYSDPVNCHILLNPTYHTAGDPLGDNWKTAAAGIACHSTIGTWKITSGRLNLSGALYQIISYTYSTLVLVHGTTGIGGSGQKYYLHK